MSIGWQEQLRPGVALKRIVQEATTALIAMDADRLEELARCCADLNRELREGGDSARAAEEMQAIAGDVRLLGSVLFETRANLTVVSRLHATRLSEAAASGILESATAGSLRVCGAEDFDWRGLESRGDYGDN